MLGLLHPRRIITQVVHEFVTNSLDACEESRIQPYIGVVIRNEGDYYRVDVKDNGPGIPPQLVGPAFGQFLAGTKFNAFKQYRGQQGIGASGVLLYSWITTGKYAVVKTAWEGKTYAFKVGMDLKKNRPLVDVLGEKEGGKGLEVSVYLKDVIYDGKTVRKYLEATHWINPHAHLTLVEPEGKKHRWTPAIDEIPPSPRSVKPHPLGVSTYHLLQMAKRFKGTLWRFLNVSFSRMSRQRVEEIIRRLDLDPSMMASDMDWELAEKLVNAFKEQKWTAPESTIIRKAGERMELLNHLLNADPYVVVSRKPKVYDAIPFTVEVLLGVGERTELWRFANFTPLVFDHGACMITHTFHKINWAYYGLNAKHLKAAVHVASIRLPYTGPGKQSIAEHPVIVKELENAFKEAGRKLGKRIHRWKEIKERMRRLAYLKKMANEIVDALRLLTGEDKSRIQSALRKFFNKKDLEG